MRTPCGLLLRVYDAVDRPRLPAGHPTAPVASFTASLVLAVVAALFPGIWVPAMAGDPVSGAARCVPTSSTLHACSCPPEASSYPSPGLAPAVAPQSTQPTTFRAASFNLLGAIHTDSFGPGGHDASSYPDFCTRMAVEVGAIESLDLDIVGLQELQTGAQADAFRALAGASYDLWPAHPERMDFDGTGIAWNRTRWALVPNSTFTYQGPDQDTRHPSRTVSKPALMLQSLQTGQRVWVLDTHHPAAYDAQGVGHALRDASTDGEASLVKQIRAQYADTPVLLFGDMNERGGFFCRLATRTQMTSPIGGSVSGSTCTPPSNPPIDWIMSTPDVTWTGFSWDTGPQSQRATDHPIPVATGSIAPPPTASIDPRVLELLQNRNGATFRDLLQVAHQVLLGLGFGLGGSAGLPGTVKPSP